MRKFMSAAWSGGVAVLLALALSMSFAAFAEAIAATKIESLGAERAPLRLLAPREGQRLPAGGVVRLAWEWRGAAPDGAEEWEAFLSLDGGRSFPLRVTPHLDSTLREVMFDVPAVAAPEVRLVIRFGDERDETAVEFPDRFSIAEAPGPTVDTGRLTSRIGSSGEPARGSDAPVSVWYEGPRDGSRRWRVEAGPATGVGGNAPHLTAGSKRVPFVGRRTARAHGALLREPACAPAQAAEAVRLRPRGVQGERDRNMARGCRQNE
jgi:hypothetical protein